MSRVYSYSVCHVYIVIVYVLYDDVCNVQVFTNKDSRSDLICSVPNNTTMTQGNTCTYLNDLTNNNNSGESI